MYLASRSNCSRVRSSKLATRSASLWRKPHAVTCCRTSSAPTRLRRTSSPSSPTRDQRCTTSHVACGFFKMRFASLISLLTGSKTALRKGEGFSFVFSSGPTISAGPREKNSPRGKKRSVAEVRVLALRRSQPETRIIVLLHRAVPPRPLPRKDEVHLRPCFLSLIRL